MREERLYPLLIQLLAQGGEAERIHQRLPVGAGLAVKLEREGHIRPLCRVGGKRLWVAAA